MSGRTNDKRDTEYFKDEHGSDRRCSFLHKVRVLKEQQEKDKRILLSDDQRRRLAAKAQQLTRELL